MSMKIYIFVCKGGRAHTALFIEPQTCRNDMDWQELINIIDNGSLVSTGLWIEQTNMRKYKELFDEWGVKLHHVDMMEANHSSCQSSCMLRGDPKCAW
jgi:hypothetical protein